MDKQIKFTHFYVSLQESRMINEALMIVQLEELAAVKQKAADQAIMREKLNEVNKQLMLCKEQEIEEERVMDLRVKYLSHSKFRNIITCLN